MYIYIIAGILILLVIYKYIDTVEPFSQDNDYRNDSIYKKQIVILKKYDEQSSQRRSVYDLIKTFEPNVREMKSFVNFYSLGCRYSGFIGPMENGYWDPDVAIKYAVDAGCRTFVLDIDYDDKCDLFPRIVVNSSNNVNQINAKTNIKCQDMNSSNIKYVCDKINTYTRSISDPIIIVLYFIKIPPGRKDSTDVLTYYSNVAKCLSPFKSRLLKNISNGNYDRQKQSDILLRNDIEKYKNKVLIFSNADTSGFCGKSYNIDDNIDDLDYLVNLRLKYGSDVDTSNSGANIACATDRQISGILQSDTFYVNDNKSIITKGSSTNDIIDINKKNWTICLSSNTSNPVDKIGYDIISSYGVNCIPAMIFDPKSEFMFSDKLFKKYSYISKPDNLRLTKDPIITPNPIDKRTDSKGGSLASPVTRI